MAPEAVVGLADKSPPEWTSVHGYLILERLSATSFASVCRSLQSLAVFTKETHSRRTQEKDKLRERPAIRDLS